MNRKTYHYFQELKLSIFEYIEGYYNSKRLHPTFGMLTPNEKEEYFWAQALKFVLRKFSLIIVSTRLIMIQKYVTQVT